MGCVGTGGTWNVKKSVEKEAINEKEFVWWSQLP